MSFPDNWEKLKGVTPPEGGWKDSTWYLVDVKMKGNNPPHKHLYFTGFGNKGYSGGFPTNYAPDEISSLHEYYYLRVIREVNIEEIFHDNEESRVSP